MSEETNDETSSEEITGTPESSFVSGLMWIFTSPKKVFASIAAGAPWWQPWVWVSLVNIAIAFVVIPIQLQLVRLNPNNMTEEQMQQQLDAMQSGAVKYLGIISAPVAVLFMSLIFALVSYLVLSVLSEKSNFRKYFTLYLYCSIVSSVGTLFSTIVVRLRGVENIRSIEDATSSFGPAVLFSGNKTLTAVLASVDLFYVWFYILLGMGAMHIFRLSGRSAFFVVIPVWLLFVLFGLISARFGMPS